MSKSEYETGCLTSDEVERLEFRKMVEEEEQQKKKKKGKVRYGSLGVQRSLEEHFSSTDFLLRQRKSYVE